MGGVGVAAELRRLAPELRPELTVTLVSEQEEQLYRPWLIYVPAAHLFDNNRANVTNAKPMPRISHTSS